MLEYLGNRVSDKIFGILFKHRSGPDNANKVNYLQINRFIVAFLLIILFWHLLTIPSFAVCEDGQIPECDLNCTGKNTEIVSIQLLDPHGGIIAMDSPACRDCAAGNPFANGTFLRFVVENRAAEARNQTHLTFALVQGMKRERISLCIGSIPPQTTMKHEYTLQRNWTCDKELMLYDLVLSWSSNSSSGCDSDACCVDHNGINCWHIKEPLIFGCSREGGLTNVTYQFEEPIVPDTATISKSAPSSAAPGSTVTYTIEVKNDGIESRDIKLYDSIPPGLKDVQIYLDDIWKPYSSGSLVTFQNVPAGTKLVFSISGTLLADLPEGTMLRNTACIVGGDCATAITRVSGAQVQLHLDKSAKEAEVKPGDLIEYIIQVSNVGLSAASSVSVSDNLPTGINDPEYRLDSGSWSPYASGQQIAIGNLAPSQSVTIDIRGTVSSSLTDGTVLVNQACIPGRQICDSAEVVVSKGQYDIKITKNGPQVTYPKANIYYSIGLINYEYSTVDAVFSDIIPDGISNVYYMGSPYQSGDPISVSLPPRSNRAYTISGVVDEDLAPGTVIENTACLQGGECAHLSTMVGTLKLIKSGPSEIRCGSDIPINYGITVENYGSEILMNAAILDTLPDQIYDAEYSLDGNDWQAYPSSNRIGIGDIAPGSSASVDIRGSVSIYEETSIYNRAELEGDSDVYDEVYTDVTCHEPKPNLYIYKEAPSRVAPGEQIEYRLRISNFGDATADGVRVWDDLPEELENAEYELNGESYSYESGQIIDLGDMGPSLSERVYIRATVKEGTSIGTILENNACCHCDNCEDGEECDYASTEVFSGPDLSISKNGPSSSDAGKEITYTIVVSNNGNKVAEGVSIVDTLPASFENPQYSLDTVWENYVSGEPITIGDVPAGDIREVMIKGTVPLNTPEGTILTNTACIEGTEICDALMTTISGAAPDLAISKSGQAIAFPGGPISYIISIDNNGDGPASNILLSDAMPIEIENQEISLDENSWSPFSGSTTISNIPSGGKSTVYLRGSIRQDVPGGTQIRNQACLIKSSICSNPVITEIQKVVSMANITKTVSATSIQSGGYLTYVIHYSNDGQDTLTGVTVIENYPSGLIVLSTSPEPDPGTNNKWTIGTLQPGESGTITITAQVPPRAALQYDSGERSIGQGFVHKYQMLNTGDQPYQLRNTATLFSQQTGFQSQSAAVTVVGEMGNSVALRQSGSGNYSHESLTSLRSKNRSISEKSSLSAVYSPVPFDLPNKRTIVYNSSWSDSSQVRNYRIRESVDEDYRYTNHLNRDRVIKVEENDMAMSTDSEFWGARHFSYKSLSTAGEKGRQEELKDITTDYIGSFAVKGSIGSTFQNRSTAITKVNQYNEPHLAVYQRAELANNIRDAYNLTVSLVNDGNVALGPIYIKDVFPVGTFWGSASAKPSSDVLPDSTWANWTLLYLPRGSSWTLWMQLHIYQVIDVPINHVLVTAGHDDHWIKFNNSTAINLNWLGCTRYCNNVYGDWKPPSWGPSPVQEICDNCVGSP